MTESAPSYKDTLNLPKTSFDMKANLTQREPLMVKHWADERLYERIRQARKNGDKGKWVLHDGPPYANGDIHMGHLINKVLKDIVVKFRTMQGYDSPFVPGWDCHGLPIESAIQKAHGPKFREFTKDQIRKECRDYALKYVKLQSDSFQRLGILGSFDNPYLTLNPKYEAGILEVLAELVSQDLVYRQKKPVHWCTFDRTALAEAELEYATRKDHSIFVCFSIRNLRTPFYPDLNKKDPQTEIRPRGEGDGFVSLMIWTTTPWTLPANRAVAVHPKCEYALVSFVDRSESHWKDMGRFTIVAKDLVERVFKSKADSEYKVLGYATGADLVNTGYVHPLDPSRIQPIVLADYVTLEDGTGLVHTAPGHGKEDYQTGQKYGLEVYNPVLPDGRFDETAPAFLQGQTIWDANALVIQKLKETGTLFHSQEFSHEYPHCWRCKKPTIQRATEQWFVKASGNLDSTDPGDPNKDGPSDLWNKARTWAQHVVKFVPQWGRERLLGMLYTRPDWCISRQRSWGVPIPAFWDEYGNVLIFNEKVVRRVAAYFKEHGADSWFTDSPAQILGIDLADPTPGLMALNLGIGAGWDVAKIQKGTDILDVWFESGASHHAVLECTHAEELNRRNPGEKRSGYPADLYLEGSDQHRGWFQSSLLEASGYKPVPPFKEVLTHGFVVDEHGKKMSKSEGNDIKVEAALKQYGADVMRLWVASVDYQNDIPCGPHLLAKTADAYRKIRNTMRYLLGNLYDFNPATDSVEPRPHSIDAWMQTKVYAWAADIRAAYDRYEFHNVFKQIYEFCNVEISAIYAKAIKDRLYCELPASPKRRASQTVCYQALVNLIELSAPVLAFTAEEAWSELRKLPGCASLESSVHLHTFSTHHSSLITHHWQILMPLIEKGNKQLDDLKRTIGLGNPLDAEAVIILPKVQDEVSKLIADYGPEIEDALGVGFHRTEQGEIWDIKINDTREKYPSCARSWKRRPDVGTDKDHPDLSARDAQVVRTLRSK
jgi:isoleucyl-tRNA synthetase